MNILTNGSCFVHADVDRPSNRLTFTIPPPVGDSNWWGRLERGDEVTVEGQGPRIELLDEAFRPLAVDLRGEPLRLGRSGVVHLRIHGAAEARIQVTRTASWFGHVGAPAPGTVPDQEAA